MRRSARFLLALLAGLAALVSAFLLGHRSADRPQPEFRALTFRQGFVLSARFLPAGSSVVYGAAWEGSPVRVFSTPVDVPAERLLDLPPGDVFAASERGDLLLGLGRSFRFDWLTGAALATVSFGSAKPETLAPSVRAADWSRDGKSVALVRTDRKGHVLERPPGQVVYRTSGWIGPVRILDGERIAFLDHPVWGDRRGRLALAERGVVRYPVPDEFESLSGLASSPDGREVLFSAARAGSQTGILAVDLGSGRLRTVLTAPGALRVHDATPDGRLLLSREEERRTIDFHRRGEPARDLCWTSHAQVAALSSDGSRALLTVYDDRGSGTGTSWLRGTDGSAPVLLGPGEATDLSPDGRWAVAIRHGGPDVLALLPVGGGEARTLVLPRVERYHWARFATGGSSLVVSASEPGRRIRLYLLDLASGDSRPLTAEGVGFLLPVTAAGDAVTSEDLDGRPRLFPLEGGSPRDVPGLLPEENVLLWLPGDTAFLAARANEVPLRVFRVEVATGVRTLHAEVGPTDRNGLRSVSPVAFSRDGTAVAFNVSRLFSELFVVDGP